MENASLTDIILQRRSVRSYLDRQISDDELALLLKCGLYAPTGGDCQYTRFIVIQGKDAMEELNRMVQSELAGREVIPGQWMNKAILRARKEGYHFIHHAPTLINVVAPKDHGNSMADSANAIENIQLAATAMGLGACWSNQPHWLTDLPEVRAFFSRYGLKENEDIFGSVSVGYPDGPAKDASARKAGRVMLDIPRDIGLL